MFVSCKCLIVWNTKSKKAIWCDILKYLVMFSKNNNFLEKPLSLYKWSLEEIKEINYKATIWETGADTQRAGNSPGNAHQTGPQSCLLQLQQLHTHTCAHTCILTQAKDTAIMHCGAQDMPLRRLLQGTIVSLAR